MLSGHKLACLEDESSKNKDVEMSTYVGILGVIGLGMKLSGTEWE